MSVLTHFLHNVRLELRPQSRIATSPLSKKLTPSSTPRRADTNGTSTCTQFGGVFNFTSDYVNVPPPDGLCFCLQVRFADSEEYEFRRRMNPREMRTAVDWIVRKEKQLVINGSGMITRPARWTQPTPS